MSKPEDSPLGKPAAYGDRYDPGLLFPIERAPQRAALGIRDPLLFSGADLWTAYELSWLDPRGKPEVAIAALVVNNPSWQIKGAMLAREVLRAYFAEHGAKGVTSPN